MKVNNELNAVLTIAHRDVIKLLRDRPRLVASLIFPIIFIGVLGGGLQASLGKVAGFDLLTFTFVGVFAQTLFQSTASGITFLIQDRENDFSQEIFVSPISRYTIIFGKIIGETLVSYTQVVGVVVFGLLFGAQITLMQLIFLFTTGLVSALLGGAFGTLILANMGNIRSAQQVFPFFIFPQIFLAGVFNPIKDLPPVLMILSRISPMTYAVDFVRGVFYWGSVEYDKIVLYHPLVNLLIITAVFLLMLSIGTIRFVNNERNR